MFAIVAFPNDDYTVDYVPKSWLIGEDKCVYPRKKISSCKRKMAEPDHESWALHDIHLLKMAGKINYFLISI